MKIVSDVVYLFEHSSFDLDFDLKFIALGGRKRRRLRDIKAYRRLNRIIRDENYDIVQTNAGDTLKYAVFSKILYGWKAPIIYRNANKMSALLTTASRKIFNGFLLSRVRRVISVSELCLRDIQSVFPWIKEKAVAVPIGTYTYDHVRPAERKLDGPVVINISSFVFEKNHIFLIRVFNEIKKKLPAAQLWLVGDGPLRGEVEAEVGALGLTDSVKFWGYRNDVISILKGADVMLMPSVVEGLPGAILEAMVCDCPVVASDVGGVSEVVHHNETGICITGWSFLDYAGAVTRILTDKPFRERIIKEAHDLVVRDYGIDVIAERFLNEYKRAMA